MIESKAKEDEGKPRLRSEDRSPINIYFIVGGFLLIIIIAALAKVFG